jgi:DNA repair exonuclease SbcCD ATPase subunit
MTEIPECCKKYDEIEARISELQSEIEMLEGEVEPKTETVKEYLQIVKDATDVGLGTTLMCPTLQDDGSITFEGTKEHDSYYRKKIAEINEELLQNDVIIKDGRNELAKLENEFECIQEEVSKIGYVKIRTGFVGWNYTIRWVSPEEFESVKNGKVWFTRPS